MLSFFTILTSIFLVLTALIFVDISIIKVINVPYFRSQGNFIELFFIASLSFVTCIIVVIFAIRKLIVENADIFDNKIRHFSIVTLYIYAVIVFLILSLNYTILKEEKYFFSLLMVITYFSYFLGLILSGLLVIKFLKWYYKEKGEYTIFGYLVTASILLIFIIFSLSYFSFISAHDFPVVVVPRDIGSVIAERNTFTNIFEVYFNLSYILCVISISAVTFFIVRGYVKINKILYVILFSLPVIYVLVKYVPPVLNIIISIIMIDPSFYGTLYTIFFSGTGPLTGFLFFLPMWFFASKLKDIKIRKYLWITSFGMLLFFTSNQEPPLQTKLFPPFGIMSSAITGLSLYFIFLGIVSAALYLSNVASYKMLVSKKLREDKFFRSIARSYFEDKLNPVINSVIEKRTFSIENRDELRPDELDLYLTEVKKILGEKKKDVGEQNGNIV